MQATAVYMIPVSCYSSHLYASIQVYKRSWQQMRVCMCTLQ